MKYRYPIILILLMIVAIFYPTIVKNKQEGELADKIRKNEYFIFTKQKALDTIKNGFNAGDGYSEVWIRDYNTFIELAGKVYPKEELKDNLLVFFRMQGEDGNIVDAFRPVEHNAEEKADFIYSDLEPRYAGHKNTAETDQESSLVQAVYKYIKITDDSAILNERIGDKTVATRLSDAMYFLMNERYNREYGLIIGATTADWGDMQPEPGKTVALDYNTHPAIDIYDNAMFIIAMDNLMEMLPNTKEKIGKTRESIAENSRKYLWDEKNQKFIPHIYLEKGSPFPDEFDENQIYYFGGTAVAIEAGLLSKREIKTSLDEMIDRVRKAGAASIGLTLYPSYPEGFFTHSIMKPMYNYQNGGDWSWFGARMIQQLIKNGFTQEAYEQIQPMVKRVKDNNGFYEWYSIDNKPRGSGTYKGDAGVLYQAILMFESWSNSR